MVNSSTSYQKLIYRKLQLSNTHYRPINYTQDSTFIKFWRWFCGLRCWSLKLRRAKLSVVLFMSSYISEVWSLNTTDNVRTLKEGHGLIHWSVDYLTRFVLTTLNTKTEVQDKDKWIPHLLLVSLQDILVYNQMPQLWVLRHLAGLVGSRIGYLTVSAYTDYRRNKRGQTSASRKDYNPQFRCSNNPRTYSF